jgi:hypothetical protein
MGADKSWISSSSRPSGAVAAGDVFGCEVDDAVSDGDRSVVSCTPGRSTKTDPEAVYGVEGGMTWSGLPGSSQMVKGPIQATNWI